YINEEKENFSDIMHVVDTPITQIPNEQLRPSKAVLEEVMQSLM
ncbi:MAG: 2-oxoacid:ferredoxin oxidoreductase subunit beta, partial [Candidatus Melainabacteria bacterium]|nr:2-oxoacid:ferredoxin oxidoreductase subunit beta [Candidatus Melainabacteria bacterium]